MVEFHDFGHSGVIDESLQFLKGRARVAFDTRLIELSESDEVSLVESFERINMDNDQIIQLLSKSLSIGMHFRADLDIEDFLGFLQLIEFILINHLDTGSGLFHDPVDDLALNSASFVF